MTGYGFKLFKLELRKRDGRTSKEWRWTPERAEGAPSSEEFFLDTVEKLLAGHLHAPERGLPLGPPDARPLSPREQKQRPVFQVEDVTRQGQHCILVHLRYGRHKDEDKGGLPASEGITGEVDLTEIAPTRSYRVGIIAPSSGKTGLLVVESIAGACPSRYFIKWFRRWMLDSVTDAAGKTSDECTSSPHTPQWIPIFFRSTSGRLPRTR